MRPPRFRLTLGGLMILVLASGLATWKWVLPWRNIPSPAEQVARADYTQAQLTREVAEYALIEYEQGIDPQFRAASGMELSQSDLTWSKDRSDWSSSMERPEQVEREQVLAREERAEQAPTRRTSPDQRVDSLKADIARVRADEAAQYAAYRAERAMRWWGHIRGGNWLGIEAKAAQRGAWGMPSWARSRSVTGSASLAGRIFEP